MMTHFFFFAFVSCLIVLAMISSMMLHSSKRELHCLDLYLIEKASDFSLEVILLDVSSSLVVHVLY